MRESATHVIVISDDVVKMTYCEENTRHRTMLLSIASHTYDKYAPGTALGVQIKTEHRQGELCLLCNPVPGPSKKLVGRLIQP